MTTTDKRQRKDDSVKTPCSIGGHFKGGVPTLIGLGKENIAVLMQPTCGNDGNVVFFEKPPSEN